MTSIYIYGIKKPAAISRFFCWNKMKEKFEDLDSLIKFRNGQIQGRFYDLEDIDCVITNHPDNLKNVLLLGTFEQPTVLSQEMVKCLLPLLEHFVTHGVLPSDYKRDK